MSLYSNMSLRAGRRPGYDPRYHEANYMDDLTAAKECLDYCESIVVKKVAEIESKLNKGAALF